MIEVRNLKKVYGTFEALKGVDFSVKNGTVFCLLGSNGAGKTTIIKIISGLLKQTSGQALIDGKSAEEDIHVKKTYGYMPEQPHLYERLTGREFLDMMASLRDID
ncbi:MAG: ATP-binding cassette domain-containing protein, partial [Thermoplasmatota archaeon]